MSELISALDDSDWTVRGVAATELGEIGAEAKRAVPKLFQMLASEDDSESARGALRAIDGAGPEAVPVLIEGLKSTDRRRQFYAIFLLGKVGPEASTALPVLKKLREDSDSVRAKDAFTRAIKQIETNTEVETETSD
jgi:HEAT repeat protein